MSIHGSYVGQGGFAKHRNVLSRAERIERLKADDKWKHDEKTKNSIFNLPKVRNIKMT
jgi:small basic protein (TIGR04137 family)